MKIITIFINLLIIRCNSFIPSKNTNKKFKRGDIPSEDLRVINCKQAEIIGNNWLNNIVSFVYNKYKDKLDDNIFEKKSINNYDELFYVNNLIEFKGNISKNNLYLAWTPKGLYGVKEVLYLIEIKQDKTNLNINRVVQSPFWNSNQISSIKLKMSLIDFGLKNKTSINFDNLYKNDVRHKLSWQDFFI